MIAFLTTSNALERVIDKEELIAPRTRQFLSESTIEAYPRIEGPHNRCPAGFNDCFEEVTGSVPPIFPFLSGHVYCIILPMFLHSDRRSWGGREHMHCLSNSSITE